MPLGNTRDVEGCSANQRELQMISLHDSEEVRKIRPAGSKRNACSTGTGYALIDFHMPMWATIELYKDVVVEFLSMFTNELCRNGLQENKKGINRLS